MGMAQKSNNVVTPALRGLTPSYSGTHEWPLKVGIWDTVARRPGLPVIEKAALILSGQ